MPERWPPDGLTWSEAAELLGTTAEEIFEEVLLGQIETVPSPSGRPLVARRAVDQRLRVRAAAGH